MVKLITVVVTHHNRPDILREALDSVQAQTVKPSEILIVDDHSTPANRKKLNEFSNFATILDTPANVGAGGARNLGAKAASGEWLCFLDDDDLYLPDKLERQLRYLESHPTVDAIGGALIRVTPDGRKEHWGGTYTGPLHLEDALFYTAAMSQSLMIRRSFFLELGGFSPVRTCMDDREFGIRLVASGRPVHFIGEPLFVYRYGRDQHLRKWLKMLNGELTTLKIHGKLLRREFGQFGLLRMRARCFRRYGLTRGKFLGRSLWALGCTLEGIFGRQRGQYD